MKNNGVNIFSEKERISYAVTHDLLNELSMVPHYWNEYNRRIIDFSGKAQFLDTGLANDLSRNRYIRRLNY